MTLNGNLRQIVRLMITLSVLHENVIVTINNKKIKLTGIWEGKTIHQWGDEYVCSEELS